MNSLYILKKYSFLMCILYSNIFAYLSLLSCKNTENIVAQAAFNKTLDFIPKSEFIFASFLSTLFYKFIYIF